MTRLFKDGWCNGGAVGRFRGGTGRRSGEGRIVDSSGLSYTEIIVALAILAIVVGVGVPFLGRSKQDAENRALQAEARTLNDAIYRVEAGGVSDDWMVLSNILHIKKDKDEAVRWLVDQGYVTQHD